MCRPAGTLPAAMRSSDQNRSTALSLRVLRLGTILVIIVLILLVGTGGGFYGYRQYGGPGLGGAIIFIIIVCLVLWLAGAVRMG